jgi:uncharacterized glyoxalase superfamily protein PhnB
MKKIYPLVITDDIKATAQFYQDNFGFIAVFEADWYIQLLHEKSGTELAFMVPNAENQPNELHAGFGGKGIVFSVEVEDAEAEWERLKDKNLDVVVELRDEEWGQRHFIVADPAGVYVDVVQQLAN